VLEEDVSLVRIAQLIEFVLYTIKIMIDVSERHEKQHLPPLLQRCPR
jgi:hypothetical protein